MQILDDLRKAYRSCDDPLFDDCVKRLREIRDAAESVVATANGNISGLSERDQLTALRLAAAELKAAIEGDGGEITSEN